MTSFWNKVLEDAREERSSPGIRPSITKGRYILRQLSGTPGDLISFKEPVTYEEVRDNCNLIGKFELYDIKEEENYWPKKRHLDGM